MPRSRPPGPATPQGPSGPPGPDQPKKRSKRFGKRSKTKNVKCSEAASAWQLAIRRGGSPGSEVYKTLAQCRAGNKTAKAGLAAGTVAGAALAERAVTSRIDRSLATATSRKAELKTRLQERARRTISDADRQRANDIASRVTGNAGGPSAALRRLQGVRAPRTRRAAAPRAIPDAGQTNRPPEAVRQQIQRNHTPRASIPRSEGSVSTTSGDVQRAHRGPRPLTDNDQYSIHSARGRAWRSTDGRVNSAGNTTTIRDRSNAARQIAELRRTPEGRNIARGAIRDTRGGGSVGQTYGSNLQYHIGRRRAEVGIRSDAAALLRNMRATGRGQQARDLSGMARMEIVARDGLSRNLNNSLRRASPLEILNQASRQGITKQPIIQGPKPPRIGLEAYNAVRSARTQPGVAESRSAAARGLRALRQAGPSGREEARIFQRSAIHQSGGAVDRGRNYTDHIVMQRQARGVAFNDRGVRAQDKAYQIGRTGGTAPVGTVAERRSAAAAQLAGLRRLRNASFAATGNRGPSNYWRDASGNVQVNNAITRPNLTSIAGRQSISGDNRAGAMSNAAGQLRRAYRDNQADRDRAAAAAAAAQAQAAAAAAAAARPAGVQYGNGSSYTPSQVRAARRQAGTFGDYTTNSRQSPAERSRAVSKAAELGLQLQGRSANEKFNHLASILGVPPEAARHITVTTNGQTIVLYNGHTNGGSHTRTIKIDPTDNRPMIYNNLYKPNARARAEGMATDHYNRQILAARAAGIQRIRVSGAGYGDGNPDTSGRDWTGYHAWVEFGFSGPVGSRGASVFRNAHPSLANFDSNSEFVDAIHHPDPAVAAAARDAWRRNGFGTDNIALEIADPSHKTMKAYQKNWKKRRNQDWARSNASTNASRNGNYDIYN